MGTLADHPIAKWRESYGLSAFVETGIGAGDGVMHAIRQGYARVISIEASPEMAIVAIQRIGREMPRRQYSVMIGPSPEQLRWITREICEPALFWLDAHVPKYYGHDIGDAYPLLDEVREIAKREFFFKDVIVADDMAMYGLKTDAKFPADVLTSPAHPDVIAGVSEIFSKTHDVTVSKGGYGHLVALPR